MGNKVFIIFGIVCLSFFAVGIRVVNNMLNTNSAFFTAEVRPVTFSEAPQEYGGCNADFLTDTWHTNVSTCDLNNDGVVTIFDFSILLSNWTK